MKKDNKNKSLENLKHFSKEDRERAISEGRKGGLKSGQIKKQKKLFKDLFEVFLDESAIDENAKELLKMHGLEAKEITNKMVLILSTYQEAIKGNIKAVEFIRDTIGEKPVEKMEIMETPVIIDDIEENKE